MHLRFYATHGSPTMAEAAVIAALVFHGSPTQPEEQGKWLDLLKTQWDSFNEDKLNWRPPWSLNGDWHPPRGTVFSFVESINATQQVLERCAEAVVAVCPDILIKPTTGPIKAYISKLLRRKLQLWAAGRQLKEPRNVWVYMEAGQIIRTMADRLGSSADAIIVKPSSSAPRWILKPDLAALKAETLKLKRDAEASLVRERVALNRAEKAEERAAVALSKHDVVSEQAAALQTQVEARRAKATNEVLDLRQNVKKLAVTAELAEKRAAFAETQAAIARSQQDLACKHAKELSEQLKAALKQVDEMQSELTSTTLENEELREKSRRAYTATLHQQVKEQAVEIQQLRERRANNMAATRQLNLERRRCRVLSQQGDELRRSIQEAWGRDTLDLAEAGVAVPALMAQIECLKKTVKEVEDENEQLRRTINPPKPMEGGAYNMKLRFTIMKLIGCANVCHSRVPEVLAITCSHWGIVMPGRWRRVLASVVEGVRQYKKKYLAWIPSANTCENIRCVLRWPHPHCPA